MICKIGESLGLPFCEGGYAVSRYRSREISLFRDFFSIGPPPLCPIHGSQTASEAPYICRQASACLGHKLIERDVFIKGKERAFKSINVFRLSARYPSALERCEKAYAGDAIALKLSFKLSSASLILVLYLPVIVLIVRSTLICWKGWL